MTWNKDSGFSAIVVCYCQDGVIFPLARLWQLRDEVHCVTDLPGPPSAWTASEKLEDLKKRTQQYTRDQTSRDDVQISYLETLEDHNNNNLRLVQMLAR
jgi:hypothetical protein